MQLPDVNVLIYAHREDAPDHELYARVAHQSRKRPEPFALPELVLSGCLRIVTYPKIFDQAPPMAVALEFCQRLINTPASVVILLTHRHAYLAALAIEHGCELLTANGDFARLQGPAMAASLASVDSMPGLEPGRSVC